MIDLDRHADEVRWAIQMDMSYRAFYFTYPETTKSAKKTAEDFKVKFLSVFSLPNVIQSGNGSEFVNDIWPKEAKFINGCLGHSQSQGMVKQGNNTIQTMISAQENDT